MRRGKGADTFTNFVRHRVSLKIGTDLKHLFVFQVPAFHRVSRESGGSASPSPSSRTVQTL